MDWNDLKVFLTAVRAGSYTEAGPRLGMNRTTVGRRVAALEAALGTALFREAPDGPEPTTTGQLLLASAMRIEAELATLAETLGRGDADPAPLRIASSAGIAAEFLPELTAFAAAHPGIAIELTGAVDPIAAVTERRADLAIALVRTAPNRLAGAQVGTVAQALYASTVGEPGPPLGWGTEIAVALPRHWTAANAGPLRFNGWPALKAAVRAGAGHAWLPCCIADREPDLRRLAPPDPRHDTGLWLLHRAATPPSAGVVALMRFLETALPARLAT